ncbi:MAG: YgaP-like transmembrane domain [Carboxydocellales bacterium]
MAKNKFGLAKILSLVSLVWLAFSYLYPIKIAISGHLVQINLYPELYLIPAFGIWRLLKEKDPYQKKRMWLMMGMFFLYWVAIPAFFPRMPLLDGTTADTVSAVHMVGALPFFLFFIAVIFLGKRADCGWNCPCVISRETVGYAFRDKNLKGGIWWKLKNFKWVTLAIIWSYFLLMILDPAKAYTQYGRAMYTYILIFYYLSYLLIPWTGNRNYCRWVCPWSATWGVLNKIGFYSIKADYSKCIDCGICEKECDMGVPIREMIKQKGEIRTTECMGCSRCVSKCPKGVLSFYDVRDKFPGYNLGKTERGIRIIVGLTLSGLIILQPYSFWGYLGFALFLTGVFGYCLTYATLEFFGLKKKPESKQRSLAE